MVLLFFLLVPLVPGCGMDDADRCRPDMVYKNGACYPQGAGPAGLGEACTNAEDCILDGTDHCAINLGETEGFCTIRDCSAEPDDCPTDWKCCNFADSINDLGYPDMCLPVETWHNQEAYCAG